jgi:hypothetical protein
MLQVTPPVGGAPIARWAGTVFRGAPDHPEDQGLYRTPASRKLASAAGSTTVSGFPIGDLFAGQYNRSRRLL